MASKFFSSQKNKFLKTGMLQHQKKLIEEHCHFLKCRIEKNVLICRGIIKSEDYNNEYHVEIRCVYGCEPYCKILKPADIVPSVEIHMYQDHSLCLHYPKDTKWSAWTPVYQYTVPWLVEWTLYYELYLVNSGKWEGPESPIHITEDEKNISEELQAD
jgi:hypothetical protein